MGLKHYLIIARRWVWLLILGAVLGGAAGYAYSQRQQPVYQASTRALVMRAPLEQSSDLTYYSDLQLVQTYLQLMTTQPVLEKTSERLGYQVSKGQVKVSFPVPAVQATKTDLSPAVLPAIGAQKQFQIEIRLPEGTTRNISVTDNLAATGWSYALSNNAGYDITYEFIGITSINGQAPGETAFTAFPADNTTANAIWNIGTVFTASEDDSVATSINPTIRIKYYGRANNDLLTQAGGTLQNSATVNYTDGTTGAVQSVTASTSSVTVVEPNLTVNKTAANVTPGKQPGDAAVGGDILEYHVIATNTGNSTAFDVDMKDTLPAGLSWSQYFKEPYPARAAVGVAALPRGAAVEADAILCS